MYHVVLAIDTEVERSLEQADAIIDIADEMEALSVTIAHGFDFKGPDDEITDLESVQRVTAVFDEHEISYDLRGEEAEPASFVTEVADEIGADLICVGGPDRSPVGKVLFGSVSQQVILESDRSVLVAGVPTNEANDADE